jgi:hypothetical protein
MAPKDRSGGMLVEIDLQVLDIGAIYEEGFYVKVKLCNEADSFKWALVAVYVPAQDDQKEKFLKEMVTMCSHESLPIMIGAILTLWEILVKRTMRDFIIGGRSSLMQLLMS